MFLKPNPKTWILTITLLAVTQGCDDKTAHVAREAADRQAQQNTEMAQLNKEVASGTHHLVEADAQARKEIIGVHHDLQSERARLDTGWDELENERRQIASQRRIESMLVSVCKLLGGVTLVVVLLGFCWHTIAAACRGDGPNAELNELLIHEILPEEQSQLPINKRSASLLGHVRTDESPPD